MLEDRLPTRPLVSRAVRLLAQPRRSPADSALVHEDDRGYANPSDVARGYSDIWVVSVSPDPQLIAYLDANGSKTDEQHFDGVRLLKYRLRSAP